MTTNSTRMGRIEIGAADPMDTPLIAETRIELARNFSGQCPWVHQAGQGDAQYTLAGFVAAAMDIAARSIRSRTGKSVQIPQLRCTDYPVPTNRNVHAGQRVAVDGIELARAPYEVQS